MMGKLRVFLTGASGGMGYAALTELAQHPDCLELVLLALDDAQSRTRLEPFARQPGVTLRCGDLTRYEDVLPCVKDANIILHVAALVSPAADYHPQAAMRVNYGSMRNLIRAAQETGKADTLRFVSIGTVAETGDRTPPIHWGRVGDPIKPAIFDYYAVSKVAAERLLIESGLRNWVSLRQTGIIGPAMTKIRDPIMFHNGLNNVLEYVSDRDSGILLRNLCLYQVNGTLPQSFWGHVYNIGGGKTCRTDTFTLFQTLFGKLGFTDLNAVLDPRWFATRNFHGQYYLDSDRLENFLHFRHDGMDYLYEEYLKTLGPLVGLARAVNRVPGVRKVAAALLHRGLAGVARREHGTLRMVEDRMEPQVEACWGSRKNCNALAQDIAHFARFTDWDQVVPIDHGYDETKPESALTLTDMQKAARFRGGECVSDRMVTGDWTGKLTFRCAFGHDFTASPRLVLEGGHWCPQCERESWNYAARAKVDPFFAQVWNPLHSADEPQREYRKEVSELDVP